MTKTPVSKTWEDEFDEKFTTSIGEIFDPLQILRMDTKPEELRVFIRTLLAQRDEEVVELLEGTKDYRNGKPEPREDYLCDCGYNYDDCMCEWNDALTTAIERIKNGKS